MLEAASGCVSHVLEADLPEMVRKTPPVEYLRLLFRQEVDVMIENGGNSAEDAIRLHGDSPRPCHFVMTFSPFNVPLFTCSKCMISDPKAILPADNGLFHRNTSKDLGNCGWMSESW